MSSVSYVESAQRMAKIAEDVEFSRVGDRTLARVNLARKYGFTQNFLKNLRYCPPKQIAADLFHKLTIAVEDAALFRIHEANNVIEEAKSSRKGLSQSKMAIAEAALLEAIESLRESIR